MLEINFCNILLVLAVVFIISFIAYNVSGNHPVKNVNSSVEGFKIQNKINSKSKSNSNSNKLDKLRNNSKNKKLAHLNSNSKNSNMKKNKKATQRRPARRTIRTQL